MGIKSTRPQDRAPHNHPYRPVLGRSAVILPWGIDYMGIGAAFAYGGLTHVMADSLTIMGVPLTPFSDRRWNFMGGRLKTGESGEFIVAGGIAMVCFFTASQLYTASDFFPFFYHWGDLYNRGIIDAYEWKQNRLNFI